jgi:hypothetical protein
MAHFSPFGLLPSGRASEIAERELLKQRSPKQRATRPAKISAQAADRRLSALGVAAAIGSLIFAASMISQSTRHAALEGGHQLGKFTRKLHTRSLQTSIRKSRFFDKPAIDFDVTGSILTGSIKAAAPATAAITNIDGKAAPPSESSGSYLLRFVYNGAALLQGGRGFYVVRRGSVLPGAGKVLSIKKIENRWILLTTTRLFEQVNMP